jgi:predicted metal-dependent phosphotriesterase family hydrolase
LAQMGVLLEYDTFNRPKYKPEENAWPLLGRMVEAGLESKIALATDMADSAMWLSGMGNSGLTVFFTTIIPKLLDMGFTSNTIAKLVGENIASCLRRPLQQPVLA